MARRCYVCDGEYWGDRMCADPHCQRNGRRQRNLRRAGLIPQAEAASGSTGQSAPPAPAASTSSAGLIPPAEAAWGSTGRSAPPAPAASASAWLGGKGSGKGAPTPVAKAGAPTPVAKAAPPNARRDMATQTLAEGPRRDVATQTWAEEPPSSIADPEQNCAVCFLGVRQVAFLPCGHRCACEECVMHIVRASDFPRCPLCRQHANSVYNIYL